VVFAATAALAGFGYSVLLPFDYTQRISFANWQYFGPRYAAFTAGFLLGLAWVITLQVHAMRRIARTAASAGRPRRRAGPAGSLAAVVSLLPNFLCCSPVVPTLVSARPAGRHPAPHNRVDHLLLRHQAGLAVAAALAVLASSGAWSAREVARAACLVQDRCPPPDTEAEGTGQPGRPAVTTGSHEDHGGGQ
jgi:hypothetical protein